VRPVAEEKSAGRILVVDDDEALQRLLERMLTAWGYAVDVAEDGARALEIASECGEKIDLLLTDLVMPGMNGRALADRFHEIHGPASVLYMSGYADDTLGVHRILDDSSSFIQKPFTSHQLAQKLGEILGY
jgi:CheY-like chemotaxis protein